MSTYALALLLLGSIPQLESGSLLVLQGTNKAVRTYTSSRITHVAILMHAGKDWPIVYEATPSEVRCVPLKKYLSEIGGQDAGRGETPRVWVMQPREPYSRRELVRMRSYLDSQIGRRYSVKGYVRKRQADGIHCAEFASTALTHSGRVSFEQPYATSPAQLVKRVATLHERPVKVSLPSRPAKVSWPTRTWQRWFAFHSWCNWACYETWRFCW